MSAFIRNVDRFNKAILYLIAAMLMIMSVVVAFQVLSRFLLDNSLPWSEELARYLMAWLVFLGAAVALRYGELIGVEALVSVVPEKVKKAMKFVMYLICLGFGIFLIVKGYEMLGFVAAQRSPALQIPITWVYASIPVSGFILALNSIVVSIELFRKDGEE